MDRGLHAALDTGALQHDVKPVFLAVLGQNKVGRRLCSLESSSWSLGSWGTGQDVAGVCEAFADGEVNAVLDTANTAIYECRVGSSRKTEDVHVNNDQVGGAVRRCDGASEETDGSCAQNKHPVAGTDARAPCGVQNNRKGLYERGLLV